MAYYPINFTAIQQYMSNAPASDYYLKAYIPNTTTAISLYTDSTGTAVAKVKINSNGFAVNASNAVTALYIDQDYKLILYPDSTTADANTTASAVWTVTVNNLISTLISAANLSVTTLAAMTAITKSTLTNGDIIQTSGYAAIGDGGHGTYYWSSASTTTDDNFVYNSSDEAGTGRFILLPTNGTYNVKQAGAKGDGTTNDTTAVQAALTAVSSVFFPAGSFYIDTVTLKDSQNISGEGKASIIKTRTLTTSAGVFWAQSSSSSTFLYGINIKDIQLLGNVVASGFSEYSHLLSLNGVIDANIDHVYFTGFQGDGIYLGSGTTGGYERHNKNVSITNCIIDGVNNDNRNGLSVIDVDGLVVQGCQFKNCTKATMPGSIDIEPDSGIFHVVRNVSIVNNTFQSCLGNVGHIGLVVGAGAYTTAPTNFSIAGNVFYGNNPLGHLGPAVDSGTPLNLNFSGNTCINVDRPFNISQNASYTNGVVISGNNFKYTSAAILSYLTTSILTNVVVTNNTFQATAGGISCGSISHLIFSNNVFIGAPNLAFGIAGSTATHLSVNNNTFNCSSGTITLAATTDGQFNTFLNNIFVSGSAMSVSFKAWRTDFCGTVINSGTATTFNTATLPDTFQSGEFSCIINGDAGGPAGTGSNQGTLKCYKYTNTSGYEKFIYQTYTHANNTLKLGSMWIRRRTSGANTWTNWYEIIGV